MWKTQRSQRMSLRSISSSTEALDSDQARQTMQRILQHTRSLPTNSPVPYVSMTDREYRSDSGLSERYTTRIPMATGGDRSSYRSDYVTEYDDYATLGNRTPTTSSMIVRPKAKSVRPKDRIERNYDHIFASIPIYDGSNRDDFFPWLDRLEAACYHCGRDIKTEALGRSPGPVQNVIMALPQNKPWSAIREELKHCFSDQISLGHTASQLENMAQKPNEPLTLYIYRYSKITQSCYTEGCCSRY